ncbi:hypothetical protein [Bradyrhizobium sp. 87]|uniref:hypothetical protein n=2 Tax=Bradyrhizobium TaxID=374 RepID=UPI001FFB47B1|nr:hypothetical protein [Bradyrhizobium sp. 87]MCK1431148.1 hypothetical protein [Bradyrhizobium sp. 87]
MNSTPATVLSFAYTAAKLQARLAKAKKAHDELICAAYRAQGDALNIEARAKRRLADEYDAAQARGEVARLGDNLPRVTTRNASKPTAADVGISRQEFHEARQIRDAEKRHRGAPLGTTAGEFLAAITSVVSVGAKPGRLRSVAGGAAIGNHFDPGSRRRDPPLAIRIVIGWISPTAGKQFSPAIDIAGTFFLKLIVVVAPVAILAVVGFALMTSTK